MRKLVARIVILSCVLLGITPQVKAQNNAVTIRVDAAAGRHPINDSIYGIAHADAASLADLNVKLNRRGGNTDSRYNWQLNADNRGADWYFQSIPFANTPGELGDTFISTSRAGGAEPMLTIPTLGWIAKVGAGRAKLASFSIAKYGAQTDRDWQWFPDAGNGIRTNNGFVTGNNPEDANVRSDTAFQRGWVEHLKNKWGASNQGGLRYYILDNEPSIWHSTHRDVFPTGATMEQVRDRTIAYAGMIKSVDSAAIVLGPEEWGWSGYIYSGYDQQYGSQHNWSDFPDRRAHDNKDYLPWLLDQLRREHERTGQRLLDVFTVHYYPQGGEFWGGTDTAMQLRRNRSTRSLWDANYTDESWINTQVRLIPRLKQWAAEHYPGTRTGITEYNWGAENHINGATAQADILGIFGRENLDMATRWTTPAPTTPTYKAIKMYRNYDNNKSAFGDISVRAEVPNPDELAAFAAVRSQDGALTVMLVNKRLTGDSAVTLQLANFNPNPSAPVERYQLTAANAITRLSDLTACANVTTTVPPQSITLLVSRPSAVSLAPVADAYVKGATPEVNYGANAEMQIKRTFNAGNGKGRQAYLRFDTSNVAGGVINRATLKIYGRLNSLTAANQNIPCAVFPVSNAAWTESLLTWANKPQPNAPQELARVNVTDDTARWYEFDVTNFINAERAAGRTTTGLLLRNMGRGDAGDYYTVFNSKEATTNRPQLVIEQ